MMKRYAAAMVMVTLTGLLVAATASAQGWRGQGRVAGKVTDESGKPMEAVTVKLFLPAGNGGMDVKTDKKGEWSAGGLNSGAWQLDFLKDGYEPRRLTVNVAQLEHMAAIEIVLKKAAPDANQVIATELQKVTGLTRDKKYAEAHAILDDLQAKYPQVYQLEIQVARVYDAEGAYDKEIERLTKYLEKDPQNVAVKLLTASVMIAHGNAEGGKQLLSTVDDSKVTEPMIFVNVGIQLLNQNKPKDAILFFDKAVARFPDSPDAYYYRGITGLQIATAVRPDDQAAGDKLLAAAKADLEKFVKMAPDAPEAAAARKILEQLK
jgi:tetratricopeptide (TPR) repeat protein